MIRISFFLLENDQQGNFNITFKFETPLVGFENNRITDFEKVNEIIKEKSFDRAKVKLYI